MRIGNTISKMFKKLFKTNKEKTVTKEPAKKNDSPKKRKIGQVRISGFVEHRFSNFHVGTFSPLKPFKVNHKAIH